MEAFVTDETMVHGPVVKGHKQPRLRAEVGGKTYPVLWVGKTSFAMPLENAPQLNGTVDLFRRRDHLGLCLVTGSRCVGDEMHYDFRRASPFAREAAEALERSAARPIVLITDALSDFQ